MDPTAARRRYAEELGKLGEIRSPAVVRAFAQVERERYLGPGPWLIRRFPSGYESTPDADPSHLYRNVLVAIDAQREVNNGEPLLHIRLIDALNPTPGERVVHIGCGTGYYTAILAHLVGERGQVTAIEVDEEVAERARQNLTPLRCVQVLCGNGVDLEFDPADGIYVNAGVSHPHPAWLDRLLPRGRLLVPLTAQHWAGWVLRVTRDGGGAEARFVSPVAIIPCVGGRDPEMIRLLEEAFLGGDPTRVRSLRRDLHDRENGCWLHAPEFCLSTRPSNGL